MCSAPRLGVRGASSPRVLREGALEGCGHSGLRAESGLESLGEGCLMGWGLPGRGRVRSPRHCQLYQPLAGGHQAPCPGSVRFRQSLPSLAVSPSRTLDPIAECAFYTHTLRAWGITALAP